MSLIRKIINIKAGEERETILFFFYFFCLISAIIIGKTARDVFFLSRFNTAFLPHIFIISAVCVAFTTMAFIQVAKNKKTINFSIGTGGFFTVSLILLHLVRGEWVYPVLYVWIDIIAAVLVPQFWLLANNRFTTRQAKRLFGPIGAASAFANIIIGFTIQSGYLQPALFIPMTALFLLVILILLYLNKGQIFKNKTENTSNQEKQNPAPNSIFNILQNHKYLTLLCAVVSVSAITITLIEYQFKMIAGNTLSESELASLFGLVYGVVGIASVFIQLFVVSRILRNYGVIIGLLILPVFLGVSSLFLTVSPVIFYALLARLSDLIFRFSIHDTTLQILWLPVSTRIKKTIKPFIDGTLKNSIQGVTGFLILIILGTIGAQYINILIVILILFWISFSFLIKKGYVNELRKAVGNRELNLESFRLQVTDPNLKALFSKTLQTGNESQKMFILGEIKKLSPEFWKNELDTVFDSESETIRKEILELAFTNPQIISNSKIIKIVITVDDPLTPLSLLVAAERNLTQIQPEIETRMSDDNPSIKASACVANSVLNKTNEKELGGKLNGMLNSKDPLNPLAALKSLSYFPYLLPADQLQKFIHSDNPKIRFHAIDIIARTQNQELLPMILSKLKMTDFPTTAALITNNFTPESIESLICEKLKEYPNSTGQNHKVLIRLLGDLGDTKGFGLLTSLIKMMKNKIHFDYILDSCRKISNRNKSIKLNNSDYTLLLISQIKKAYRLVHASLLIQNLESVELIKEHLQTCFQGEVKRILYILDIQHPDKMTAIYIQKLHSDDTNAKSNVLEILENRFPKSIRKDAITLLDESSIAEKLQLGPDLHISRDRSIEDVIMNLINSKRNWEQALGVQAMFNNKLTQLINLTNGDEIIENPFALELFHKELKSENSGFKSIIRSLEKETKLKEGLSMYTTLDKTVILKGVDLFSDLSSEEVFQIAQIANEERYLMDEIIFNEGGMGDSMFIIISGSVSVFNLQKEITTLGEGECFGEMALLDREPRSNSIKAVVDTTVLKIDEVGFYELAAGNIEIIQGIVKILSKRLRKANAG